MVLEKNSKSQIVPLQFMKRSSYVSFLVTFWLRSYENTKILRNLCLLFARQDGQDRKTRKENHASKVTKIPKTKRRKYGMNETYVSIKSIWLQPL